MSTIKHLTYKYIHTVVDELHNQLVRANYVPDFIMPIARGGIIPAGILGQYYPEARYYLIQTKSYVDKTANSVTIFIPKSIAKDIDKSSKILIVDDIYDTGNTLQEVRNVLKDNGIKNNIATATLYLREEATGTPDFFVESIKKKVWLNFPWELKE